MRGVRALVLFTLVFTSILNLSMIARPVAATDYVMTSAQNAGDFYDSNGSHYAGSAVSDSKLSADNAYQSSGVVYGPNNPIIYTGLSASTIQSYRDGSHYLDNFKIAITIKDSSGNVVSGSRIGNLGLLDSPHGSSGSTDWVSILTEMYNFLTQFEGLPSVPNLQFGQTASGVQPSDSNGVSATWTDQGTPLAIVPDKGLTFRYQPNFPSAGVYTFTVTTSAELWVEVPYSPYYFYQAKASSSYSFSYVYENDAGLDGDAGSDFSTARGIALGSYSGLLYGADTVDMYKFDVTGGQTVYYQVIPPISANFPVAIYHPDWTYATGSNLGVGAVNYGSFTAATTGSWFMKISLISGSGPYSFTLSNTPLPQDFTIDANPTSLCLPAGASTGSVITLRSLEGYSGTVTASSFLSPSNAYVSTYVTASPLSLTSSGYAQTGVEVQASSSDFSQGSYTAHVTASSGSLSHSLDVPATVNNVQCPLSGSGSGGGSVAAGTLITLADGSAVPVQLIQAGALVRTYNVFSQTTGTALVSGVRTVVVNNQLEIYTASGLPFRTDANPFFRLHVMHNGQVALMPVTEIQPGDLLFSYNDMTWVPVEQVRVSFGGQHTVYDLTTNPIADFIANGYADCVKACRT